MLWTLYFFLLYMLCHWTKYCKNSKWTKQQLLNRIKFDKKNHISTLATHVVITQASDIKWIVSTPSKNSITCRATKKSILSVQEIGKFPETKLHNAHYTFFMRIHCFSSSQTLIFRKANFGSLGPVFIHSHELFTKELYCTHNNTNRHALQYAKVIVSWRTAGITTASTCIVR